MFNRKSNQEIKITSCEKKSQNCAWLRDTWSEWKSFSIVPKLFHPNLMRIVADPRFHIEGTPSLCGRGTLSLYFANFLANTVKKPPDQPVVLHYLPNRIRWHAHGTVTKTVHTTLPRDGRGQRWSVLGSNDCLISNWPCLYDIPVWN